MRKFEVIKRDFGHSDEDTTFELPLNMTLPEADPDYFDDEERFVLVSRHVEHLQLFARSPLIANYQALVTTCA
jgi:hypothetical protein